MVGAAGKAVVRRSVRALLVDESSRVLLLASEDPATGMPFCFLPQHHLFAWRGVLYGQRERWFQCRVQAFEPSGADCTATEVQDLKATRWWTLPELAATPDRLTPRDLPDRLERLLREGRPTAPVEVGV